MFYFGLDVHQKRLSVCILDNHGKKVKEFTVLGDAHRLVEELDQMQRQVKRIEAELDRVSAEHAGVTLLRTIPGVGPRTAEAVLAYVDQAGRFQRNKQIGAYFGLEPTQDASADTNRPGHITQQGPGTARGCEQHRCVLVVAMRSRDRQHSLRHHGGDIIANSTRGG